MFKLHKLHGFARLGGFLAITLALLSLSSHALASDPFARPVEPFKNNSDFLNNDKENDSSALSPFEGGSSGPASSPSASTAQPAPASSAPPRRVQK